MSEVDVTTMSREERRAWLAETKPRHDLAEIIRAHIFYASRDCPDGTKPSAPNWNPGCRCGEAMYFFEHDDHLADAILAAGFAPHHPTERPAAEAVGSEGERDE